MNPLMIAGGLMSGIGSVVKMFKGGKMERQGNKILGNRNFQQYQSSPYAAKQLGMASQLYNAKPEWMTQAERGIQQNQANFMGNVNNNATDSSQALALAAAGQGQSNQAYGQLGMQAGQYKMGLLQNLNNAYGQMIGEGDKVYNSMAQKYQMDTQEGYGLKGAGMQNTNSGFNDLAGGMFGMGQLGLGNNWFKKA